LQLSAIFVIETEFFSSRKKKACLAKENGMRQEANWSEERQQRKVP
jgi:hypothetical protein